MIDATVMRVLLGFFVIGMALFGLAYLSRRALTPFGYLFYGALVIFIPVLGPFWVIALRPGKRRAGVSPNPPRWFIWLGDKLLKRSDAQQNS